MFPGCFVYLKTQFTLFLKKLIMVRIEGGSCLTVSFDTDVCVWILSLENLETWEPHYAQRGALGNEYFSLKIKRILTL